MGRKGGPARAKTLTAEERRSIASLGGSAAAEKRRQAREKRAKLDKSA